MEELMDEGERKEEPSVRPDYVSLAQLQERWLQKQEEKKLREKEEEEKEEEERKLKEKEEEERKRERDARAEKGKNQNRRGVKNDGRAKIEGEFMRDKGLIEDKGKGKVTATDGSSNRGENNSRRGGPRGRIRSGYQKAAAVEEKLGVLREECGGAGGVVEICSVCVVQALPINGVKEEIRDVKRTNLRGGLRGNGRRVNELEQSEMGLGFDKKVEGERNHGENWRGRRVWRERDGDNQRRFNLLEEFRPVVSEKKGEDEVSGVCHEISSLSIGGGNGIGGRNNTAGEDRVEGERSNGVEIEKKADNEVIAGEGARIGREKGSYQRRRDFGEERRYTRSGMSAEGSNGNKVVVETEKKVEPEVLAGESATVGEKKGGVRGYRKNKNRRRSLGQEEGSNGNKVALEIDKKVDPEVLDGESAALGEKKGVVKGYRKNKNRRDFGQEKRYTSSGISAEEGRVEEEGSNGSKVALVIEKKKVDSVVEEGSNGSIVEPEVLVEESAALGEKKGTVNRYRRDETRGEILVERPKSSRKQGNCEWLSKKWVSKERF